MAKAGGGKQGVGVSSHPRGELSVTHVDRDQGRASHKGYRVRLLVEVGG